MAALQKQFQIPIGQEWDRFAGLTPSEMVCAKALIESSPFTKGIGKYRDYAADALTYAIPDMFLTEPEKANLSVSTQTYFGQVLLAIGKSPDAYANRVMTMAPDVATSTNLSGFVNTRGVFGLETIPDQAKKLQVMSANKWDTAGTGQHVELGIAENNLFLMLAAAGLAANTYGQRIFPIGTIYDPFISRGLDALNYACYQDSRFLLVATPSGISLSPEGGAHQSINTPLIGMSQPGLTYFEPTFGDELQVCMSWAFRHMQKPYDEGGSVYLRLSTRPLSQLARPMTAELRNAIIQGAYWHHAPSKKKTKVCLAFTGCVYPQVLGAYKSLVETVGGGDEKSVALMQITSPHRLYHNCHMKGTLASLYALYTESYSLVPVLPYLSFHSQ